MKNREKQFLKLVERIAALLDIEFTRSHRSAYRLRLLKRNEPVIDVSARSLDRLQYDCARAIVAVRRAGMVREFKYRKIGKAVMPMTLPLYLGSPRERGCAVQKGPSKEQIEALRLFAKANGRSWKSKLNHLWMNGAHNNAVLGGADPGYLQQVRNSLGPSWLTRFRLEAA